ncbi:MAG TPA: amidohydrolase family protein [Acidimicrobiia bacterium]|nr:amidohydrolase family protein [Acidimicrobiia bacterium]
MSERREPGIPARSGAAPDLVVRGATVVDGSGAPPFTADVAVRDGRVTDVGRVDEHGAEELDADGAVLAPGFVDIHTHYDAQLQWEPTASPSSWHGVTTVITGNCGFSLFPARPDDLPWLLLMLSRVEGMPPDTLAAGATFAGGGCADFAANLEAGGLGVNVGLQVGHSAVRRYVLGDAAVERAATAAEITEMTALVGDAVGEGAVGFTSSQLDLHVTHDGHPVPSNLASPDELVALAGALAEFPDGALEFISRTNLEGHSDADRSLMLAMCAASGKPMNVNPVQPLPNQPDGWRATIEFAEAAERAGARVYPQSATQQLQVFFALADTFLFDEMPAFRDTLTLPAGEREQRLFDANLRDKMRAQWADTSNRHIVFGWDNIKVARADHHPDWVGLRVPELRDRLGVPDELEAFLDASLAEDLQLVFTLAGSGGAGGRRSPANPATATIVAHPLTLPGSSDAGAHLSSYCGVDYTTRLLTEYVPDALPLEQAVARLTAVPAAIYGLADRGIVRPGAAADLVLWDPARLASGATRWVEDFPAGGGRFVVDAEGYLALVVNGAVVRHDGVDTGARAGRVVRRSGTARRA